MKTSQEVQIKIELINYEEVVEKLKELKKLLDDIKNINIEVK